MTIAIYIMTFLKLTLLTITSRIMFLIIMLMAIMTC